MMNTFEKTSYALGALVVGAAAQHNLPGWLEEQTALNYLQAMDSSEGYMKTEEMKRAAILEQKKPGEASAISEQCSGALKVCLDGVQMPNAQSCADVKADVRVFHESIAKPRESSVLSPRPEVYKCDLIIQSAINKCHEGALYCLEKPLR